MRQCLVWFFFFQAEDGIRYLVRSRGLGDVYKRQGFFNIAGPGRTPVLFAEEEDAQDRCDDLNMAYKPVSYTHLTLPTSDLV